MRWKYGLFRRSFVDESDILLCLVSLCTVVSLAEQVHFAAKRFTNQSWQQRVGGSLERFRRPLFGTAAAASLSRNKLTVGRLTSKSSRVHDIQ